MTANQKGWFHAALVAVAVAEFFTAKTRFRKMLLGLCAGYHAEATYYHFVDEVEEPRTHPLIDLAHEGHRAYGNLDSFYEDED
jgi:hypothetical protein